MIFCWPAARSAAVASTASIIFRPKSITCGNRSKTSNLAAVSVVLITQSIGMIVTNEYFPRPVLTSQVVTKLNASTESN